MRLKLSIHNKMMLFIIATAVLIFGYSIGLISIKIRDNAIKEGYRQISVETSSLGYKTKIYLENFTRKGKSLSELYAVSEIVPAIYRDTVYRRLLIQNMVDYPWFVSVGGFIFPDYFTDSRGYFYQQFYRDSNKILSSRFIDPTWDTLFNQKPYQHLYLDQRNIVEYRTPVIVTNEVVGGLVIKGKEEDLYQFVNQLGEKSEGVLGLLNSDGKLIAYSDTTLLRIPLFAIMQNETVRQYIEEVISQGVTRSHINTHANDHEKYIVCVAPVSFSSGAPGLALAQIVPYSNLLSKARHGLRNTIITGVLGLIVLWLLVWVISRMITSTLGKINTTLQLIAIGDVSPQKKFEHFSNDEIGLMMKSINQFIDGVNGIVRFASEIGKGNLEVKYTPLGKNDLLGLSLEQMRQKLIQLKIEEENQQVVDRQQAWVTSGIAHFGEILRQNSHNLQNLCDSLTKNICHYMQKPQCTIFVANDETQEVKYFQSSTFAFGNYKLLDKEVVIGEELIGHIIQTRRSIRLDYTPETFPIIKPELSDEQVPTNFLLIPLTIGTDLVVGALEIVSYEPFKPHEIEFVEKLSANVASTINSVKINARTAELLKQSQEQKDILAQHEEEMRQNMEEMLATQEETMKRETELKSIIKAFDDYCMVAHLSLEGKIIKINHRFAAFFGLAPSQMEGKFYEAFAIYDGADRRDYMQIWNQLLEGNMQKKIHKIDLRNKTAFLMETYIPLVDNDLNEVQRVILVAQDISYKVSLDREISSLVSQIEKISRS